MISIHGKTLDINYFPDGTFLLKDVLPYCKGICSINWAFENNEEMAVLWYIVKHLQSHGFTDLRLFMPYIPNARQDRVKTSSDVFTLKYFAEFINSLKFKEVVVLDPHSYVSEALINNIVIINPITFIDWAIDKSNPDILFFPDEGAMKRYSNMTELPYAFGIKKRDWATGQIQGLDISGSLDKIKGSTILIVDDICSKGGTFYHSAKKLKELGANDIYLYVTHCENTILQGDILDSGLINKVFTTNSIYKSNHKKIEVFNIL